MLAEEQKSQFWRDGYLFIDSALPDSMLANLRSGLEDMLQVASGRGCSDDDFDLAEDHVPGCTRCHRIKEPYRLHPAYEALLRSPLILDIAADLISDDIMLEDMPLNLKAPGADSVIGWHQDWAFMPRTNDAAITMIVFLCDCDASNGAMSVIPRTHRMPMIFDHHHNGRFAGSINPADPDIPWEDEILVEGRAGSISIHHTRTVHGSRPNMSNAIRPLQAIGLSASNAWPLVGTTADTGRQLSEKMLRGSLRQPRLEAVPVRLPFPPPLGRGSIFKVQHASNVELFND